MVTPQCWSILVVLPQRWCPSGGALAGSSEVVLGAPRGDHKIPREGAHPTPCLQALGRLRVSLLHWQNMGKHPGCPRLRHKSHHPAATQCPLARQRESVGSRSYEGDAQKGFLAEAAAGRPRRCEDRTHRSEVPTSGTGGEGAGLGEFGRFRRGLPKIDENYRRLPSGA